MIWSRQHDLPFSYTSSRRKRQTRPRRRTFGGRSRIRFMSTTKVFSAIWLQNHHGIWLDENDIGSDRAGRLLVDHNRSAT